MEDKKKRKSESNHSGPKVKKSKPWMVPKKGQPGYVAPSIEPGDVGIWATCPMGKEGKCTSELRDLFEEYATKLYGKISNQGANASDSDDDEIDIENEIKKEVQDLKSSPTKKEALFQPVKTDIQCVLFFKTRPPIEPVEFVQKICKDALQGATKKHRWVKRLTPISVMGKATEEGLDKVATAVLEPVFHSKDIAPMKFAIRPTRRNHNVMQRDDIIKQIAGIVGSKHSVDLKNYDHLILVDVYRVSHSASSPLDQSIENLLIASLPSKNVLGMSVVGNDYEELKQFNLAEIYDPTPKSNTEKPPAPTPDAAKSNSLPTNNLG